MRIWLGLLFILSLIIGLVFLNNSSSVEELKDENSQTVKTVEVKMPEKKPPVYADWEKWHKRKLLHVVTDRAKVRDLPKEDREFFRKQIENKDLPEVIRNNMANGLVYSKNPDENLHNVFIKMYDDKSQSPKWRDYSLQFLAETLTFTSEKEKVLQKLKDVAEHSENNDGATAIILLNVKHKDGIVNVENKEYEKMVSKLNQANLFHTTKVALIGIIRSRKDDSKIDLIQKCVTESQNNSVIRTGLAAIGVMGGEEHEAFILKYKNDERKSIRLAANYALKQLNKKKNKTTNLDKKVKGDYPA